MILLSIDRHHNDVKTNKGKTQMNAQQAQQILGQLNVLFNTPHYSTMEALRTIAAGDTVESYRLEAVQREIQRLNQAISLGAVAGLALASSKALNPVLADTETKQLTSDDSELAI